MEKMTLATKSLRNDVRGANMVEYMVLVGIVALICIAGFTKFAASVNKKAEGQGNAVSQLPGQ